MSRRLARQIPAALEQRPGDLKRDCGLAGAGGERQQDALRALGDRLQRVLDGVVLIVAGLPGAAALVERDRSEAVAPFVRRLEDLGPKLVRRRVALDVSLLAGRHVDPVDAPSVGGVGEERLELCGVGLGLADAFGVALVARLGLDHRELVIAEGEDVVGDLRLAVSARTFDAPWGDDGLAANPAVGDDAPSCRPQRGVDQFGAGLGFVHAASLRHAKYDTKRSNRPDRSGEPHDHRRRCL